MQKYKNPLKSKTPLLAGVIKESAPPETPFLTADGEPKDDSTPVMQSFSVLKPATSEETGLNTKVYGGVVF